MDMKKWSIQWGGRELSIEAGKLALQAHGACVVRYGDTVVLATVVKSKNIREGIDYFPLMVDFEEKLYAAGKIKGSRFIKREGRPSDEAILAGRMVDRAIRPLFDETIRNDVQVVLTPLSVDGENDAAIVSLVAASAAVAISPIPWHGPIGAARIGMNDSGFILNATTKEVEEGILNLVVAGTPGKLIMVEASSKEIPEDKLLEAMRWGCGQLEPVINFIKGIQAEVGQEKSWAPALADDLAGVADETEEAVRQLTRKFVSDNADAMIFDKPKVSKSERAEMADRFESKIKNLLDESGYAEDVHHAGLKNLKLYIAEQASKRILDNDQRLDNRKLTEIRPLTIEVDLLPRVHGSGLFMRGDTQVLSVVTLGAPGDMQTLDTMEEEGKKRYMHHYNDAPFAYGEAGPLRGPGRRAIGHGSLAERALEPVLPLEEEFPYAIRVVSEVMGSNGSSSMASACGSTLSLMAAGVPIKKPVAGIAMGLASESDGGKIKRWKVLTDLQDVEDGPGGMDFKLAGTRDGITVVQMDTKTHGLTWEIVERTLKEGKDARIEILDAMKNIIEEPRKELSPYAPRIETIRVNPEKIGDIIGPGGKTIKKIIEETGVDIDIEQDGRVLITSVDAEAMKKAIKIIQDLTREVAVGEVYEGPVVRLEDFGAFVQILPNKDGMVHVSEIAWERVNRPGDVLHIGDKVKVLVKEIDNLGRVNLSMKSLISKPDGWQFNNNSDQSAKRGFSGEDGPRRGGFGFARDRRVSGGGDRKRGFFARRDRNRN